MSFAQYANEKIAEQSDDQFLQFLYNEDPDLYTEMLEGHYDN